MAVWEEAQLAGCLVGSLRVYNSESLPLQAAHTRSPVPCSTAVPAPNHDTNTPGAHFHSVRFLFPIYCELAEAMLRKRSSWRYISEQSCWSSDSFPSASLLSLTSNGSYERKVLHVQLCSRAGDETPISTFPAKSVECKSLLPPYQVHVTCTRGTGAFHDPPGAAPTRSLNVNLGHASPKQAPISILSSLSPIPV